MVHDGFGGLSFRNALLRDCAYDGLTFRLRRELHAAGRRHHPPHMAARPWGGPARAPLVPLPARPAVRTRRGRTRCIAAERAKTAYANVEGAEFYERALLAGRRLPELDRAEMAAVHEALGDARNSTGTTRARPAAYRAARRLVGGDPVGQARLLLKLARVQGWLESYSNALRWITKGLRLLEGEIDRSPPLRQRAELLSWYGRFCQEEGHHARAITWCTRAVEHGRGGGRQGGARRVPPDHRLGEVGARAARGAGQPGAGADPLRGDRRPDRPGQHPQRVGDRRLLPRGVGSGGRALRAVPDHRPAHRATRSTTPSCCSTSARSTSTRDGSTSPTSRWRQVSRTWRARRLPLRGRRGQGKAGPGGDGEGTVRGGAVALRRGHGRVPGHRQPCRGVRGAGPDGRVPGGERGPPRRAGHRRRGALPWPAASGGSRPRSRCCSGSAGRHSPGSAGRTRPASAFEAGIAAARKRHSACEAALTQLVMADTGLLPGRDGRRRAPQPRHGHALGPGHGAHPRPHRGDRRTHVEPVTRTIFPSLPPAANRS